MASRGVTTIPIFYIDLDGTISDTPPDDLLGGSSGTSNNKYDVEESRLRLAHVLRNRKQQQQQQQQLRHPTVGSINNTIVENVSDAENENAADAALHRSSVDVKFDIMNDNTNKNEKDSEHPNTTATTTDDEHIVNSNNHNSQEEWDDDEFDDCDTTTDDDNDMDNNNNFDDDDGNSDIESNTNLMTQHQHSLQQPHPTISHYGEHHPHRNRLPGAGQSRMMLESVSHQQQQRRYATSLVERDQQLKMNQMMARSQARNLRPNRGNSSKALPSQFVYQPSPADNAAARAIVHHTGSHYHMAGSKQFQRGVRVKGVVSRHSQQGAKLQAARISQKNMYEAREDARGERAAGAGKNKMKQSKSKKSNHKSSKNDTAE